VIQLPIDAIRPTNELAPVARMFGLSVDSITNQMRKDLLGTEGTTGVPGRYVVVALADGSYEMRLVKTGPTDLRVQQVTEGVAEGDKVVMLGAIIMGKPAVRRRSGCGQHARADATGIADPGGRDRNTSRSTRGREPAEAGGSQAEREPTRPRKRDQPGNREGHHRIAIRILLSPGDRYGVRSSHALDRRLGRVTDQRGRDLESFVERRQRGGA
jgi:hypothetical protein